MLHLYIHVYVHVLHEVSYVYIYIHVLIDTSSDYCMPYSEFAGAQIEYWSSLPHPVEDVAYQIHPSPNKCVIRVCGMRVINMPASYSLVGREIDRV